MEKIYTIIAVLEDICEPTKIHIIGSYHSLDNAKKAMDDHIKNEFSKIVPEVELDDFIKDGYQTNDRWVYDDDNGLIAYYDVFETTLND